ncbi:DNA translocase FtsK [Moraxella catarrhalis]|uniref:DNA translocase FtsK n=1 Tax=Moraxella catarrhalis TaxID=480 RepID=UPI00128CD69B|nr:DNA translocase FtsK [Moraxella catarrhalis]MDE4519169.1 DNA translocase FtsK [Moraxella catarrhalis]MPW85057.1 cell division protein FtsK [Moraxella catarrhalis]MPW87526.1 DNA translocase FtsK [Moraxella catarrhalis]MPW93244.1 cell division protein FtsK [Moraxella catarrhalis]MPX61262.1 DNA translocase FtsK [Moraxella catarrhalis]
MSNLFQNPTIARFMGKLPTIKQLIFSIFGIVLLVFLFLSLLSYDQTDSAWSHVGSHSTINNVGGLLGAWVSDILHTLFGFGAWVAVLVLAYELVRLWWSHVKLFWVLRLFAYGLLILFVSALLAYIGEMTNALLATRLGGAIGFELQKSLAGIFGGTVTALLLIGIIILISLLSFEIRWRYLMGLVFHWIGGDKSTPKVDLEPKPESANSTISTIPDESTSPVTSAVVSTPHNHEGVLESFLRHSGLRDELIAERDNEASKQAAKAEAENIYQETQQAATTDPMKYRHDKLDDATHLGEPNEPSNQIVINNNPSTVERFKTIQKVGPNFDENQATEVKTTKDTKPTQEQTHQTPKPKQSATPVQSRAMDTLSHRLSLTPIPELDLLDKPNLSNKPKVSDDELQQASELLEIKLQEFNIQAQVVSAMVGPVVTRFEVELAPGVKASRVTRISQDLARSMSKASLRVVEVIPGKPYIGIEVPNQKREMVHLLELLDTKDYQSPNNQIAIAVGKDISGKPVIADLAKAPHMLVAGTTGSGKSVLVNSFLLSMLLKYTPDELKLVLIDPKQLELANYGDIPHLLTPVITDMKDAVAALTWCVNEMERRYQLMSKLRVRKISEFNKKVEVAEAEGEPIYDPLWHINQSVSQDKPPKLKPLPTIVIVADEFADMIMQLGKTAEEPIVRLAQKARAAGIHLLLATQRPTVNVVTGLIKANIPARVALRVSSKVDSRTIIEEGGAEDMLGHGDMMFIGPGKNHPERVHGAYVDDDEVNRVCDAWRERGKPDYIDLSDSYSFEGEGSGDAGGSVTGDELYEAAAAFVVETKKPSISSVQRKFSIGYNRAARLLDQMEERGLVSSMDNSGKRQLLL